MGFYFDPGHLFAHVQDSTYFEIPKLLSSTGHINIPNPMGFTKETPMIGRPESPFKFVGQPTKFMVLELFAALLLAVAFIWLARKVSPAALPKARSGTCWRRSWCLFATTWPVRRLEQADADRYMPFLLTLFFFILLLNLFGMIPFLGSPTASLAVTAVFAIVNLCCRAWSRLQEDGCCRFFQGPGTPHGYGWDWWVWF